MPNYKQKEKDRKPHMGKSSGNVFLDLGYPTETAINIVTRLELMMQIEDIISKQGWTQQQAAQILRIRQPRVSELISSRSEKFTIDMLIKFLDRLGRRVEFKVKIKHAAA